MGAKNKIGSIVEGQDFVGRVKEIEDAWELLENRNSLILAAPRRVGKSSFSKKMIEKAKDNGWSIVDINLEGIKNEADFIDTFISHLEKETWYKKAGNFFDEIKLSIKDYAVEWKRKKISIYKTLKEKLVYDKDTLIIFDELTIFLDNLRKGKEKDDLDDVDFLLHWLRGLRQVSDTKIRWIFCSSVSIESFMDKHKLSSTINDMIDFKIDELKGDEAVSLIKALAESKNETLAKLKNKELAELRMDFSDEIIDYMLKKLKWKLPYFIQLLFRGVVDLYIEEKKLSTDTVEKAYLELINSRYFKPWYERLSFYPEDEEYIRLILDELSKSENGINRKGLQVLLNSKTNDKEKSAAILTQLLFRLINDGYIMINNENKYLFRSPLLRDFWYNRFIR